MMKRVCSIFFTIAVAACHAGTFRDDRGVTHEISGKPTIVTFAHTAVTLSHFGLDRSQLVGVYGEFVHDGSDYDFENLQRGSTYPADPTPEEMEFITSVPHISPSCLRGYCQEFDLDIFRDVKPDYIVMHGYRGDLWGFDADKEKQVVNIIGKPIIYIDVAQQGANCISEKDHESCYGKSMIEVVEQYYELAKALGVNIPSSVEQDRLDLCKAAETFQDAAEIAHANGVRAIAGYISVNEFRNATSYLAYPPDDMVLRMFEELGMPLIHPGICQAEGCSQNYFWEWIPTNALFPQCSPGQDPVTCDGEVLYPADMWLYDHRTTLSFTSPDFRNSFPDPAVLRGQYEYWPIGGGIISFKHAAEILSIMAPALAKMERIHDRTPCTAANVSSIEHAQDGLAAGSYACFDRAVHRASYLQCPAMKKKVSNGAIIGICCGVVGLLLGVALLYYRKKRSVKKENLEEGKPESSPEATNNDSTTMPHGLS